MTISENDFRFKNNETFSDHRGKLHECFNIGGVNSDVEAGGHLYAFTIEQNQIRGDHYHKEKKNGLCVLKVKF